MENSETKPRVFLSHSKLDEKFVDKIYKGLLKCKCYPWLDTEEIRDGRPWLDVIFQAGIPACDVLIVYLTPNSIGSKMVQKELNAAFVEQLRNDKIQILPYVSDASLRSKLRADIASLQCREWNPKNFSTIFPTVVTEIWRSFMEKKNRDSVLREKGLRLELEQKLSVLQQASENQIFSKSEMIEFEYLNDKLSNRLIVPVTVKFSDGSEKKGQVEVNRINFLADILNKGSNRFDASYHLHDLYFLVNGAKKPAEAKSVNMDGRSEIHNFQVELKRYGLIDSHLIQNHGHSEFLHQISHKYRRFVYWLEYNKKYSEDILKIEYL